MSSWNLQRQCFICLVWYCFSIAIADAMRQVPIERHIDMAINSLFLVKVEQAIYQNKAG